MASVVNSVPYNQGIIVIISTSTSIVHMDTTYLYGYVLVFCRAIKLPITTSQAQYSIHFPFTRMGFT